MLSAYTKLAFGYSKVIRGERFWTTVFVGYESNSDRYAVYSDNGERVTQISKLYKYRGWAEREIKKIHKDKQKAWLD